MSYTDHFARRRFKSNTPNENKTDEQDNQSEHET